MHDTYQVQGNHVRLLLVFVVGWAVVLLTTLRWGRGAGVVAMLAGLVIPASPFLLKSALRPALMIPEIVALNAAYWLVPAIAFFIGALALRRRRPHLS